MTTPKNSRRELLAHWLQANVKTYKTPEIVTLSHFEIDVVEFTGTFIVSFDEQAVDRRFSFGIKGNGLPKSYLPIFVSPLGVPASFPAVQLSDETEDAIEVALAHLLPRLRPFGLNKMTGEQTDITTPNSDRVLEPDKLAALIQVARSNDLRLQIEVKSRKVVLSLRSHSRAHMSNRGDR